MSGSDVSEQLDVDPPLVRVQGNCLKHGCCCETFYMFDLIVV